MDLIKVRELVENIIDEDMSIYDIKVVREYGELILQILIDKKGGIDINELARINDLISEKIDTLDSDMPEYLLEVSSPGAEKELRTPAEVDEALGKYIHLRLEDGQIFEGYLEEITPEELIVKINIKGRIKNQKIDRTKIKFIRLAVKV